MKTLKLIGAMLLAAALVGCTSSPEFYSIGGSVSGLDGTVELSLDSNGTENLSMSSNSTFNFTAKIKSGLNATVSVKTQPENQLCDVSNGAIVGIASNISNVTVTCRAASWRVTTGTGNLDADWPVVNWSENPTSGSFVTHPYQLFFTPNQNLIVAYKTPQDQTYGVVIRVSDYTASSAFISTEPDSYLAGEYNTQSGAIYRSSTVYSNANLNGPKGMVLDASGNIFVADSFNFVIKKIDTSGAMSVFAGSLGNSGSDDGQGTAAKFTYPWGMAIDSRGNLYVADYGGHTIRKISPTGLVSTLAGTAGAPGSSDGTGAGAKFKYPSGLATDSSGNIYVADTSNNAIRKITPSGVVTTLAGRADLTFGAADGALADARFNAPRGIAVDSSGTIYIADYGNNALRRIKYVPTP